MDSLGRHLDLRCTEHGSHGRSFGARLVPPVGEFFFRLHPGVTGPGGREYSISMSISLPHGVVVPVEVEKFLASATDSILIDGERRPAASGETLESFDPGTGAPLTAIAAGGAADVDRAVSAARSAFEDVWRDMKPAARGRLLADFAGLVEDHAEELADARDPRRREAPDRGAVHRRRLHRRDPPLLRRVGHEAPRRRAARLPARSARRSSTPGGSRSGSSGPSCPGTSRCSSRRGRSARPWPPGTPWCSSRRR